MGADQIAKGAEATFGITNRKEGERLSAALSRGLRTVITEMANCPPAENFKIMILRRRFYRCG